MNIVKTLITATLIIGVSASMAFAGGLGHKKKGPPPAGQERVHKGGNGGQNGQANDGRPNNGGQPNGGGFRRPVELIGPELGVTGEQFAKCFEAVNPAPQGTEPTAAREMANKAVLLPCLQAINPDITNDLLDSVSNKYRPSN